MPSRVVCRRAIINNTQAFPFPFADIGKPHLLNANVFLGRQCWCCGIGNICTWQWHDMPRYTMNNSIFISAQFAQQLNCSYAPAPPTNFNSLAFGILALYLCLICHSCPAFSPFSLFPALPLPAGHLGMEPSLAQLLSSWMSRSRLVGSSVWQTRHGA